MDNLSSHKTTEWCLYQRALFASSMLIKSTNFTITNYEDKIAFNVLGFGHGVGLSQVGANEYARQGKSYKEIIHHYYTDVDIVNIDN